MKKQALNLFIGATLCSLFFAPCSSNAQVPSYVPTNGLVGWWPFNGNANDESGYGNNGINNSVVLTNDRNDVSNSAYYFDGANSFITVTNNSSLNFENINSFTFCYWINPSSLSSPDQLRLILSKQDGHGVSQDGFNSYVNTSSSGYRIQNGIQATTEYTIVSDINTLLVGEWNHVVQVWSGSQGSVFLNGGLVSTTNGTAIVGDNTANLLFGKPNWVDPSVEIFHGKLDDIGIWNRALTACEILDLYHAQLNSSLDIYAGTDQAVCIGDLVTLTGAGGTNYQWSGGITDGLAFAATASQDYILSGSDVNGCIGTDTVNVSVLQNSSSTQTQSAIDSYTWPVNGQTYTQSGSYTSIIQNAAGCDSTITLNLTLGFTGIEDLQPNANKKLQRITDLNGKETPFRKNTVLIFIYEDGTIERVFEAE